MASSVDRQYQQRAALVHVQRHPGVLMLRAAVVKVNRHGCLGAYLRHLTPQCVASCSNSGDSNPGANSNGWSRRNCTWMRSVARLRSAQSDCSRTLNLAGADLLTRGSAGRMRSDVFSLEIPAVF